MTGEGIDGFIAGEDTPLPFGHGILEIVYQLAAEHARAPIARGLSGMHAHYIAADRVIVPAGEYHVVEGRVQNMDLAAAAVDALGGRPGIEILHAELEDGPGVNDDIDVARNRKHRAIRQHRRIDRVVV